MIIKVKKPKSLGIYPLNKQGQRVALKNIINKQIKLVRSFGKKVFAVLIVDGEKSFIIFLNK